MTENSTLEEALRNIERLKKDLGEKILKKIGKENEANRIEPYATIFPLTPEEFRRIKILILGLNGYFNEKPTNDGSPRPADYEHSYFKYFRDEFFNDQYGNNKMFAENEIGFFDLVPVRTGGKKYLDFKVFKDELLNEIWNYLEAGIKIFRPEIILTNSSDVGRFVKEKLSSGYPTFWTTITYFPIKEKSVPVVLSGHLSGSRRSDEFNRARILREIYEEMNRSSNRLGDNHVKVQTVHRHDVANCEVCKGDIREMQRHMSFGDYDEADEVFSDWKKHTLFMGMSEP